MRQLRKAARSKPVFAVRGVNSAHPSWDPKKVAEVSRDLGKAMVGTVFRMWVMGPRGETLLRPRGLLWPTSISDIKGDAVNFRDREGGDEEGSIPKKRKLHGATETQLYGSSWR